MKNCADQRAAQQVIRADCPPACHSSALCGFSEVACGGRAAFAREVLVSSAPAIRASRISRIVRDRHARRRSKESSISTPSFADLGVSDAVVDALDARGIATPFPIQRLVIGRTVTGLPGR